MTKLDEFLNEVQARVDKAHKEICSLAKDVNRWRMRIPAQPDDSDRTLQAPLDDIETLLKIVRVQQRSINYFSPLSVSSVEKEIQSILEERSK